MRYISTIVASLALAVAPMVASGPAAAAPNNLSPADQAAAQALAAQIEGVICQQAPTSANQSCLPAPCTTANANMQQQIQQLIIAAGLQPNVVLAAVNAAGDVLPRVQNANGPSCEVSALNGVKQTVLAQIGGNKPAGAGGPGGTQNGGPPLASTGGTATD